MENYCVSCQKNTGTKIQVSEKLNKNRLMLLSKCAVYDKKLSTFIKNKGFNNISSN